MVSSSGASSGGSSQIAVSGSSEEELRLLMKQRKQKRMLSNRESARRSRLRKQKHVDDQMAQLSQLRKENGQILTALNITSQNFVGVESENSVLRAQMMELSSRLQALNEIIHFMQGSSNGSSSSSSSNNGGMVMISDGFLHGSSPDGLMRQQWWSSANQPIVASLDMFQYC